MTRYLSQKYIAEIETFATELAEHCGNMLWDLFPNPLKSYADLDVEFKDLDKKDPVTRADNEVQEYMVCRIKTKYPDHGVIGEEGETADGSVPDILWVLDPLDGTRNFMYGYPAFACSIGVLYRGIPVCGVVFLPWPGISPGILIHSSKGNGVKINDVFMPNIKKELDGKAIVTLPGSFSDGFRFNHLFAKNSGEPRTNGSIAYEMSLVAMGITQFAVISGAKLWDVAGTLCILSESGGDFRWLNSKLDNNDSIPIVDWNSYETCYKDLLDYLPSLVAAPKNIIDVVVEGIEHKSPSKGSLIKSFLRF